MNAIVSYFRGALEELHQVRWPTRQQAIRLSAIVIGFILVSAVLVGIVDAVLNQALRLILVQS